MKSVIELFAMALATYAAQNLMGADMTAEAIAMLTLSADLFVIAAALPY